MYFARPKIRVDENRLLFNSRAESVGRYGMVLIYCTLFNKKISPQNRRRGVWAPTTSSSSRKDKKGGESKKVAIYHILLFQSIASSLGILLLCLSHLVQVGTSYPGAVFVVCVCVFLVGGCFLFAIHSLGLF